MNSQPTVVAQPLRAGVHSVHVYGMGKLREWQNDDWSKTGKFDLTKATNKFIKLQSISKKYFCNLIATVLHRLYTKS